jgi:hypothetical protein
MRAAWLATLLLAGCCSCPLVDTANRVAASDFSERADGALLRCTGKEYVMSVKIVRPKDGQP